MWGVVLVLLIWALLTGWVGKQAASRGRMELLWAPIGAIAGIAGFALGCVLIYRSIDLDGSISLQISMMLLPLALMIAALVGVGMYVRSRPINLARRASRWNVHVIGRGTGTLHIDGGDVVLAWDDGNRRTARANVQATADGESVRLTMDGDALALMPLGKPDSAEWRRVQSQQLARQLGGS